jgi:hypothetical protein
MKLEVRREKRRENRGERKFRENRGKIKYSCIRG